MSEPIFLWPDGSIMWESEYCEHEDSWRGDDFEIVYPDDSRYVQLCEQLM